WAARAAVATAAAVGARCWAGKAAARAAAGPCWKRLCQLTAIRTATAAAAAEMRRRASARRIATRELASAMVSLYFLRRQEGVAYPKRQERKALARCKVSR
ncbi:MAG: hypothetical protein CMM02_02415, partial [Rhodopirellula sp.]|nr:hypothetical protein [Rhodopirellula sp.]